jgi:hypothetical protein
MLETAGFALVARAILPFPTVYRRGAEGDSAYLKSASMRILSVKFCVAKRENNF